MNLRNNVRLIGNLGQDPEVRQTAKGSKVATLSIATSESYKNEKGEKITETQWHNLVAWGKQVDTIAKYLKKGSEIAVDGKLHSRSYVDKEGIKRYVTEIMINDFLMIGGKKDK
jgi:single-strand DNA-binding protein